MRKDKREKERIRGEEKAIEEMRLTWQWKRVVGLRQISIIIFFMNISKY